jgi:hypothetical protein
MVRQSLGYSGVRFLLESQGEVALRQETIGQVDLSIGNRLEIAKLPCQFLKSPARRSKYDRRLTSPATHASRGYDAIQCAAALEVHAYRRVFGMSVQPWCPPMARSTSRRRRKVCWSMILNAPP